MTGASQTESLAETATENRTTCRAAVIAAPRQVEVREIPLPQPGPDQVRIRMQGCGVCASNIPVWQGRDWFNYPQEPGSPGHEGWGYIDAVGASVTNFQVGERVAAITYHAYAEYDIADASAVVKLPAEFDAYPFPAEPIGCAMNVFHRSHIRAGETVAIVGIGFLGALLTSLCASAGAEVIAITRRQDALKQAEGLGARHLIPMKDHWEIIEKVKGFTGGQMCDCVIEAVGEQWPLDLAAELVRERGRLIIAGYHQDGPRQVNMQQWNWKGLDVINAHERDPRIYKQGMEEGIQAILRGQLDPSPLYTHTFSLDQLGEAFKALEERPDGFMKALIAFNQD